MSAHPHRKSKNCMTSGNVICGNEAIHGELVKILKPLGK
jgi:hypothetical protein